MTNVHNTILINNKTYQTDQPGMTGTQIKALANIPANYELFLVHDEGGAKPDEQIPSDRRVDLRSGMKFRAIPPGNQG